MSETHNLQVAEQKTGVQNDFAAEFIAALGEQPGVVAEHLPNHDRKLAQPLSSDFGVINNPYTTLIEGGYNPLAEDSEDDMRQKLLAVVNAGGELFGILRVDTKHLRHDRAQRVGGYSWNGFNIVTHMDGQDEPSIAGVLYGKGALELGRSTKNGWDDRMSRKHFSVKQASHSIRITDLESMNGTTVARMPNFHENIGAYITHPEEAEPKKVGLGGIKKLLKSRKLPENPIANPDVWAVSIQQYDEAVRRALASRVHGSTTDPSI